jgi:hypothetical protein
MEIPCLCPPKKDGTPRHEKDTVTFKETLDFKTRTIARKTIGLLGMQEGGSPMAEVLATLTEFYLLYCIESWSLVDEKGKPVPVSKEAIRERVLSNDEVASQLGDEADALYSEAVLLPLVMGASRSSPPTPTNGSTSPTNGSGRKHRKPSRPSSTSITPTVAIAATAR